MAYDERLATRIREKLVTRGVSFDEKKMFGGLAFMVGGHMCVGVIKDEMCLRLDPEDHTQALDSPYIRPFDFTGRPMRGWLVLTRDGTAQDAELETRIDASLAFVSRLPRR